MNPVQRICALWALVALFVLFTGHALAALLLLVSGCLIIVGGYMSIRMATTTTVYCGPARVELPALAFQACLPCSELPAKVEVPGLGTFQFNIFNSDLGVLLGGPDTQQVEVLIQENAFTAARIECVYFPYNASSIRCDGWMTAGRDSLIVYADVETLK